MRHCRFDTLMKTDLTAQEDRAVLCTLRLPENHVCGEFEYVARAPPSEAEAAAEDDGFLVGFCTDEVTMKSFLLVRVT
jgi:carotenoid cleavage dioxygenase-like enzyme